MYSHFNGECSSLFPSVIDVVNAESLKLKAPHEQLDGFVRDLRVTFFRNAALRRLATGGWAFRRSDLGTVTGQMAVANGCWRITVKENDASDVHRCRRRPTSILATWSS